VPYMMERNELPAIYISASSDFAGMVKKPVTVKIFRIQSGNTGIQENEWPLTDVSLYDSLEFVKWFPETIRSIPQKADTILVHETSLLSGDTAKLILPAAALPAGAAHLLPAPALLPRLQRRRRRDCPGKLYPRVALNLACDKTSSRRFSRSKRSSRLRSSTSLRFRADAHRDVFSKESLPNNRHRSH